jgi:hypothetical protein
MKELKPGDRVRVKQLAVSGTAEACQDGTVTEVKGNAVHVALDVYNRIQAVWFHRQQCVPLKRKVKQRPREWVIGRRPNDADALAWLGPELDFGEQITVREVLSRQDKTP